MNHENVSDVLIQGLPSYRASFISISILQAGLALDNELLQDGAVAFAAENLHTVLQVESFRRLPQSHLLAVLDAVAKRYTAKAGVFGIGCNRFVACGTELRTGTRAKSWPLNRKQPKE